MIDDYAERMDRVAATWDRDSMARGLPEHNRWRLLGRADGLREAARVLRDKENR